jgi:hypothetical protein
LDRLGDVVVWAYPSRGRPAVWLTRQSWWRAPWPPAIRPSCSPSTLSSSVSAIATSATASPPSRLRPGHSGRGAGRLPSLGHARRPRFL